jgi:hypothetical protein
LAAKRNRARSSSPTPTSKKGRPPHRLPAAPPVGKRTIFRIQCGCATIISIAGFGRELLFGPATELVVSPRFLRFRRRCRYIARRRKSVGGCEDEKVAGVAAFAPLLPQIGGALLNDVGQQPCTRQLRQITFRFHANDRLYGLSVASVRHEVSGVRITEPFLRAGSLTIARPASPMSHVEACRQRFPN